MALFKRRLRSVKDGWNEIAAVVMEMQETLERYAEQNDKAVAGKQDKLVAGDGIEIAGTVISAVPDDGGE